MNKSAVILFHCFFFLIKNHFLYLFDLKNIYVRLKQKNFDLLFFLIKVNDFFVTSC